MDNLITIACSKGYLWDKALNLLEKIGYDFDDEINHSRQLFFYDTSKTLKLMKIRPWDVPVYLEEGAADLGIVGKDVLLELTPNIVELQDLNYGHCRLVIAGPEKLRKSYLKHNIRVATKYQRSTLNFFKKKSIRCIPIALYGAMELAPSTGVSDIICDLTATGQTLKDNGLVEFQQVFSSTARLVSNRVSLMTKYEKIDVLSKQLNQCL